MCLAKIEVKHHPVQRRERTVYKVVQVFRFDPKNPYYTGPYFTNIRYKKGEWVRTSKRRYTIHSDEVYAVSGFYLLTLVEQEERRKKYGYKGGIHSLTTFADALEYKRSLEAYENVKESSTERKNLVIVRCTVKNVSTEGLDGGVEYKYKVVVSDWLRVDAEIEEEALYVSEHN